MPATPNRFADNPFYVLGVSPQRTRGEIEREGTKLLGMLELGLRSASTYETPAGPRTRTPEAVRAALAELRIPDRRLLHELWAGAPVPEVTTVSPPESGAKDPYRSSAGDGEEPGEPGDEAYPGGFAEAYALFGWRRP